jgi:ATP-dependent RNA helicase RhlE
VPEDYVHRIGRTGRAERTGEAISLVCVDEHKLLRDIERLLKREIPRIALPGYEPDPSIKAEPIINGRQAGGRGAPRGNGGGQRSGNGGGQRSGNGGGNGGQRENRGGGSARPQGDGKPRSGAPRRPRSRPAE